MSDIKFGKAFIEILENVIDKEIQSRVGEFLKDYKNAHRLLSVPELAEYSGFSTTCIYNWLKKKRNPIPHFKVGKWYRIYLNDFLSWLEQYQVGSHEGVDKVARY
jgi:excisionase family DNA binding protein